MVLVPRKLKDLEAVEALFLARITGGTPINRVGVPELYLHGLTLIFSTPSNTITFAATPASAQAPLTAAQVVAQIKSQSSNAIAARIVNGCLQVWTATPGTIVLDKDGTANPKLGFSVNVDTTAVIVNEPGGSTPALVVIQPLAGDAYLVVIDE